MQRKLMAMILLALAVALGTGTALAQGGLPPGATQSAPPQDGLPTGATQSAPPQFLDLDGNHWAADAITRLTALGVLTGYPNATFGGSRAATRYELAVVTARLLDLLSTSITDLIGDPEFQQAIRDASENNARILRLEQLLNDTADVGYVLDLAERLANVEEYLNAQAGQPLFPGMAALDDMDSAAVGDRDPLSDEEMAMILSELEQQIVRSRSAALPDMYFGVQAGYPVVGGLHFGMRDVFAENFGARVGIGYALPGAFSMELFASYAFPGVFGIPEISLYTGPGVLMRVGSVAALDLELLLGVEYSLPQGPVSLFAELGPAFTLTPSAGDASLIARLGMNYGF